MSSNKKEYRDPNMPMSLKEYEKKLSREDFEKILNLDPPKETVNHPSHYNSGNIETIEAIEDWGWSVGFCAGNAIKYISRHQHKNKPVEDLKKAQWYIERLISFYKNKKEVK